jgi:hypothetical protein
MTDSPRGRIRGPRMPSLSNAAGDLTAVLTVPTPRPGDFPGGQQEAEQEAEKELEAG